MSAVNVPDEITVKSGEYLILDDFDTTDPDGDNFCFLWFNYPEAGSYKKIINIDSAENIRQVWVVAPKVEKQETVHFILKVTDMVEPQLSRYKRVIVTILPE